ncbi:MAG: class I SAM-dependent methyltransferase [Verrucomicrobiales bacterium]|nr:class I SAM-dependent methyltransferase [Verrucomicrobiales bacterium]
MFGFRDTFDYVECEHCGCIQICEVPSDLARYYPPGYGAHEPRPFTDTHARQPAWKRWLKERLTEHALGRRNPLGALLALRFRPGLPYWVARRSLSLRLDSPILEVGAGAGDKLLELRRCGFRRLLGVDPFIAGPIEYEGGVRILRGDLDAVDGSFDFIMLHHAFEHMPEPRASLRALRARLRPGGWVLIRIPVAGSHAWKRYGSNWVQLDAPRHLFLHTPRSLELLAAEAGLRIAEVFYDSRAFQFWGSEQYRRDIPLHDPRSPFRNPEGQTLFSREQMAAWAREAEALNARGEGDQACFYLRAV